MKSWERERMGWIDKQESGTLIPYNPCSRFRILFESQPDEGSKINLAYVISCHVYVSKVLIRHRHYVEDY